MPVLPVTKTNQDINSYGTQTVPATAFDSPINQLFAAMNDPTGYINPAQDSGVVNAYATNLPVNPASLVTGLGVALKVANTSTGASTFQIGTLTAANIIRPDGSNVLAGDLVAGQISILYYDGTNWELTNPKSGIISMPPTLGLIGHRLTLTSGDPMRFTQGVAQNIASGSMYWTPFKGTTTVLWNSATSQWVSVSFPEQAIALSGLRLTAGHTYLLGAYWNGGAVVFGVVIESVSSFYPGASFSPVPFFASGGINYRIIGHISVMNDSNIHWFSTPSGGINTLGISDFNFPLKNVTSANSNFIVEAGQSARCIWGGGIDSPMAGDWVTNAPTSLATAPTLTINPAGQSSYNALGSGWQTGYALGTLSTQSGGYVNGTGQQFHGSALLYWEVIGFFVGSVTGSLNQLVVEC